jgi:hypothetical protein
MLFDTAAKVTALLDLDFSWVTHPAHEFITGLGDISGCMHLADEKVQATVLSGRFGDLDDGEAPSLDAGST